MKIRAYAIALVVGILCLLLDVLVFGSVAARFPAIADQARAESLLAHSYNVLGGYLLAWLPSLKGFAGSVADAAFAESYTAVSEFPRAALTHLLEDTSGIARGLVGFCYWGAPLFLVVGLILYVIRPRTVHLIGGSKRFGK